MNKNQIFSFVSIFAVSASAVNALSQSSYAAAAIDNLSPAQQEQVKAGKQVPVFVETGKADEPWPKAYIYQKIEASPKEAAAMFSDYKYQKEYLENLNEVTVAPGPNKAATYVTYVMGLPMGFGSEKYTVLDTINQSNDGSSYRISWNMIKADTTKKSEGYAHFEPLDNSTLLLYYNYIVPGRWGSDLKWVIAKQQKFMQDTVTTIAKQVVKVKTTEPNRFKAQMEAFEAALAP